jgi:MYXO-CTERM domain-containing protein
VSGETLNHRPGDADDAGGPCLVVARFFSHETTIVSMGDDEFTGERALVGALAALAVLTAVASPAVAATAEADHGGSQVATVPTDGEGPEGARHVDVTVLTAPSGTPLHNESVLAEAFRSRRLVEDDTVAVGDRLVVRIATDDVVSDLAAADGDDRIERLRSLFATERYRLTVNQTRETTQPMREPKTLGLLEPEALEIVPVGDNVLYLAYDTDSLPVVYGGDPHGRLDAESSRTDLGGGDAYDLIVEAPDGVGTVTVATVSRTVDGLGAGDAVYGVPGERTTVRLATSVAPETELRVRLAVDGDTRASTATVRPDGTLAVPVDARALAAGANGTLTVVDLYDGRYADGDDPTVPVRVRSVRGTVESAAAGVRPDAVRVETAATLSHPGFVVVKHDGERLATLGSFDAGTATRELYRELDLRAGAEVTFVAVRDIDQDGELDDDDVPFAGGAATRTVVVADERPATTSPSPTTDPPETSSTTPDATATGATTEPPVATQDPTRTETAETPSDGPTTGVDDTDGSMPGLGVGGALAALVVVLALAGRRRR